MGFQVCYRRERGFVVDLLPLPPRERAGVRVKSLDLQTAPFCDPLSPHPALSPEYRGEGSRSSRASVPGTHPSAFRTFPHSNPNRKRYFRNRSASLGFSFFDRETANHFRPASESDRLTRQ